MGHGAYAHTNLKRVAALAEELILLREGLGVAEASKACRHRRVLLDI